MKRPYFHIKALDKRQLKNWNEYLELEKKENDPYRVIFLFERCLVACAQYEEVWCKYARYMEEHVKNVKSGLYKSKKCDDSTNNSVGESNSIYCKNVVNNGEEKSMTESSTDLVSERNPKQKEEDFVDDSSISKNSSSSEGNKKNDDKQCSDNNDNDFVLLSKEEIKAEPEDDVLCISDDVTSNSNQLAGDNIGDHDTIIRYFKNGEKSLWTYEDVKGYASHGVGLVGRVIPCPRLTRQWVYQDVDWEDVRQIYRRAAWIHCANKPAIAMQWAEFEEMQGKRHRFYR